MLDISDNNATVKLNNMWAESEENKKKGVSLSERRWRDHPIQKRKRQMVK